MIYKKKDIVNYKLNGEIVKCEIGLIIGEIMGIRPLEGNYKDIPVITTIKEVIFHNEGKL